MLTLEEALAHAGHTLGGDPADISPLSMVNQAGTYLYSVRRWRWLEGAQASLDLVADQQYVDLPTDLQTITAIDANSTAAFVDMSTTQGILQWRTKGLNNIHYRATVVFVNDDDGIPRPRLEIHPTPSAAATGAIVFFYKKRWVQVTEDDDYLPIPDAMVPLFIEYVRAFARGYDEEDEGTVSQRLAVVQRGPIFEAAVRSDAAIVPNVGQLTNGMAQGDAWTTNYWDRTVNGPS